MIEIGFTLCFLTRGQEVLLLHRKRPPNAGLWNGVGGHIEAGETPLQSCLREVQEETGFHLPTAHFAGLLTWSGFEIADGGLALFTAPAPDGTAAACTEGRLAWYSRSFLFRSPRVVSNLLHSAPHFMNGAPPLEYHFVYQQGKICSHTIRRIPGVECKKAVWNMIHFGDGNYSLDIDREEKNW